MPIVFGQRPPMKPLVEVKVNAATFALLVNIDTPYSLYSNGTADMDGVINGVECLITCEAANGFYPYRQWLEYRRATQSAALPNDPAIGKPR